MNREQSRVEQNNRIMKQVGMTEIVQSATVKSMILYKNTKGGGQCSRMQRHSGISSTAQILNSLLYLEYVTLAPIYVMAIHLYFFISFFLSLAASLSLSHTHPILLCLCPSLSLHPSVSLFLSRSLCLFFSPLHPLSFYTYLYICMYLFSELSIICSNNYIIGLHYARIQCFITIGDFKTSFFQQISLNDVYVYFQMFVSSIGSILKFIDFSIDMFKIDNNMYYSADSSSLSLCVSIYLSFSLPPSLRAYLFVFLSLFLSLSQDAEDLSARGQVAEEGDSRTLTDLLVSQVWPVMCCEVLCCHLLQFLTLCLTALYLSPALTASSVLCSILLYSTVLCCTVPF